MEQRGTLIAVEKSANKRARLAANCRRHGAAFASVVTADAGTLLVDETALYCAERASDGSEHSIRFERGSFDRVMLDPPCSALGQRPRAEIDTKLRPLLGTARYQQRLFQTAVELLRPGGRLV